MCIRDSYICECAELCPSNIFSFLHDSSFSIPREGLQLHHVDCLQNIVMEIIVFRLQMSFKLKLKHMSLARCTSLHIMSIFSLTLRLCLCWFYLIDTDPSQVMYFTAVVSLHVGRKTRQNSLTDEMLDVLATTCLRSNDARRCLNARHSSVLSLSQAATLMKVVANSSCSTVQLIEIELAKAYLFRTLRCKDSGSNSVYCLANVYLAVLYYTTGQFQTAIYHCTLVMRSQCHAQCSSHVVQGERLPSIGQQVDNILGLVVLYKYIRAVAFNEEREMHHVSVFTTELFAHYLHIRFQLMTNCYHQRLQTSLAGEHE